MNKILFTLFLFCICNQLSNAQCNCGQHNKPRLDPFRESHRASHQPSTSFTGFGIGINDYGLGIGTELNIGNNIWLYGTAGISTWGYRLTGGVTYYPGFYDGYNSSISLGYSYATGITNFETSLEIEPYEDKEDVELDLNPISTLNLVYAYNIKVGRKSKLVLSSGYAIVLTSDLYQNNSGEELTEYSKDFIKFMAPGGVILGLKFMFGN